MLVEILMWTLSLGSILGVLVRPRGIGEAWWACGGAGLLVLGRLIPLRQAGSAIGQGLDVYLFLAGMMILAELAREEGVFEWIAEVAAGYAHGSARRLFLLIYAVGTIVTVFLSNDATAVVLTPAVLTIVRRLKVEAVPHLLACALIANAASFVLPISNPANLVIYARHLPSLSQWLKLFLVPAGISIVLTFAALRFVLRRELRATIAVTLPQTRLAAEGRLALGGLILGAAMLMGASALGWSLGAATCAAAAVATALVALRDRAVPRRVAQGVAWSVIPLVAGLFVIVEALQRTGLLRLAVAGLQAAARVGGAAGNLLTAFAVGLLANAMNNLPVGLIGGSAVQSLPDPGPLARAVVIGVDLGPNLSVTGSLATILWLIALRRERVHISGWRFFKVGLVAMPLALLGAVLALGN